MTSPATPPVPATANPLAAIRDFSDWIATHWLQIAVAVAAGIVIYLLLNFIRALGNRFIKREDIPGVLTVVGRTIRKTSHLFMMIVAARLVAGYADPPEAIFTTIRFLFTVIAVFQVAIWLREIILGVIELRAGHEGAESLANAMGILRLLVSLVLFAVATIVILDNLGVNVTGLVAGLGIGGIAIGLAAQGIFSDLFAALSILLDRPFRLGEAINFGSSTGTVERIGLKSTRLRAVTGEKMVVSNAQLLNKEITSYATLDRRRIKFTLGFIYQTSPDMAESVPDIIRGIVEEHGGTYVRCGFIGFGDSSLDFEVEFDVFSSVWDEVYEIRHKIGLTILRTANERGLEFAYPTQTTFTSSPDGTMIMPYPAVLESGAGLVAMPAAASEPKPATRKRTTTKARAKSGGQATSE